MNDSGPIDQDPGADLLQNDINISNNEETDYSTLFFMLGNACMLLYAVLVNGIDIFMRIFGLSDAGDRISFSFNLMAGVAGLLFCMFRLCNLMTSILIGLVSLLVIIFATAALVIINIETQYMTVLLIILAALAGAFSALLFMSSSILSFSFDKSKFLILMNGYTFCGVITSALRIITKGSLSEPTQQIDSAACYLLIASMAIIIALIVFIVKCKTPVLASKLENSGSFGFTSLISRDTTRVLKSIWNQALVIFMNVIFTVSLFPGFMSHVQMDPELGDWTVVIVTCMFYIFSWLGNFCPSKILIVKPKWTWLLLVLRFWFLPLFVLPIRRWVNLGDPLWTFCWMIPFAVTHGYTETVTLRYSMNETEIGATEKKLAVLIMFFAVYLGLLCAMGGAYALRE